MNTDMKRTFAATALTAVALLVGACSSSDPGDSDTAIPAGSEDIATVGTPFDVKAANGSTLGTVTILDIEKNPTCTDKFGDVPPVKGTPVAVRVRVETPADYDATSFVRTSSRDFTVLTVDGLTKSAESDSDTCIADRDRFMNAFAPSSTYDAWVLLDVPDPNGSLRYKPQHSIGSPGYTVPDLATARDSGGRPAPAAPEPEPAPAPPAAVPTPPADTSSNPVDQFPNPHPGSYDSQGRPSGTSGATLVRCAMDRQPGTGIYSDGSMDYAAECLVGGSMRPQQAAPTPAPSSGGVVIGNCDAAEEGQTTISSKGELLCSNGKWITTR